MNNNQRRILFILVIVFLGAGLILMVIRRSQNLQEPPSPEKVKADFEAELKQIPKSTTSSSPQIEVQWRVVIAKGKLKGKTPPELDCPKLETTDKAFLAELARRYPDIQFSSPASGKSPLFNNGFWYPYPQVKYPYAHPELGTLHVGFPVAVVFTPEKSTDKVLVANSRQKDFHLVYDELFSSASINYVTQVMRVSPLFRPEPLRDKDGVSYVTFGQTVLLESYSCYFRSGDQNLSPIDTHMLFYRVVRSDAP